MGLLDANLQFSNAQAITASAASTNVIDLADMALKTTTFTPSAAGNIGPNNGYFGEDLGIGAGMGEPRIQVSVGTAFATLTSLRTEFQAAPDNETAHASGNISDLTFVTAIMTDAIAVALLTAGARIASFAWPKRALIALASTHGALPRFVRLFYTVDGSNATAGTVTADVALGGDDAQDTLVQYGSGYAIAS